MSNSLLDYKFMGGNPIQNTKNVAVLVMASQLATCIFSQMCKNFITATYFEHVPNASEPNERGVKVNSLVLGSVHVDIFLNKVA